MSRGNCYAASEALYHITGGKEGPWRPQVMRFLGDTHWFLRHKDTGEVLDPSVQQFHGVIIPYEQARGCGFLTKKPSLKARILMEKLTWQQ